MPEAAGNGLVARLVPEERLQDALENARSLPALSIGSRELADLELLAVGGFSPLTGFLGHDDYRSVVHSLHLTNGDPWSIPITFAVSDEVAAGIQEGDDVCLVDGETHDPVARLTVQEIFRRDVEVEARNVYGTTEAAHPGVAAIYQQGNVLLGGPVDVFRRSVDPIFARYALTPAETRAAFASRGWKTVVGFQTRNPVHRAHEYIQKSALETVDGLLLHPLVGLTKADDVPASIRLRCYEALVEHYYPADRVVFGVMLAAMRYAGPREAVLHALIRRNFGCTHFIVGRDHAGVGNYYGIYDAQRIFERFDPARLGIQILKFENAFYCRRCGGMASLKTCPHDSAEHISLSGSEVRRRLREGEPLPPEFSRPEVAEILREAYAPVSASGE